MGGREATVELLTLVTGDDFEWSYTWDDGAGGSWPTGRTLYYQFQDAATGDGWVGGSQWSYTIVGAVASLRIESTVADAMPDRTPYRLIMADPTTSPTTEHVLIIGNVKRQEPKL